MHISLTQNESKSFCDAHEQQLKKQKIQRPHTQENTLTRLKHANSLVKATTKKKSGSSAALKI
jgi:hypothetical protein